MSPLAKVLGFSLVIVIYSFIAVYFRGDSSKGTALLPYYFVKKLHVEEKDLQPRTKALAKEEHSKQVPCDDTCKIHIHFCGYFDPDLPQGTYCCTETGCNVKFTYSKQFYALKDSDAIILHHSGGWNLQSLLRERRKNQVFIFMTREAGSKILHKSTLYNMSMTHRFDSDFRIPYGAYNNTPPEKPDGVIKDWTNGKTKLAAWMASNCQLTSWPRTEFVKNLSKLIPIDTFGQCGKIQCKDGDECRKILRNYKFYFALENQLCRDYITEKFWYNALCNDVVPIVFGAARSEYEKVAPSHSFIHLEDFSCVEDFLSYITLLDKNPALYNSYFEWKKHGTVRRIRLSQEFTKSLICDISTTLKRKRDLNVPYEFRMEKDFWVDTCRSNVLPWSK